MKIKIQSYMFTVCLIGVFLSNISAAITSQERSALISIYNSTGGDNWYRNSDWKTPPLYTDGFAMPGTEGSWYGVTVSSDHVVKLDLNNDHLIGSIPTEIGDLVFLTDLVLCNNQLNTIHDRLGNCTNLVNLQLYSNAFTGPIPARIGALVKLKYLNLSGNSFSSIPHEIGNLTQLITLCIAGNQLSTIPAELGNLPVLSTLELHENRITGVLFPQVGNLTNLEFLTLNNNLLTGLPSQIGNLTKLNDLYLSYNQISTLPAEIGNMTMCRFLELSHNRIVSLPLQIGNLSQLNYLDLSYNLLTTLPSEIGRLERVEYFYLNNNSFTSIHPRVGDMGNLYSLVISNNQLTTLPPEFGKLVNLSDLHANNNRISSLPVEMATMIKLSILNLSGNQLTTIPVEFKNMSSLSLIDLSHNRFTTFPPELGSSASHDLSYNSISGTIPPQLLYHPNRGFLDLSHNNVSGTIPPAPENMYAFYCGLDLSYNQLTGAIPPSFFTHLEFSANPRSMRYSYPNIENSRRIGWGLNLSNNKLSGHISSDFKKFIWLESLNLSNNEFTGSIPIELSQSEWLVDVNVSRNFLSGNIPTEIWSGYLFNFDISSNFFTGDISANIISNQFLYKLNIGYNAISPTDSSVITYLNIKDPDWLSTQTLLPTNISAKGISSSAIKVSWTPIAYTADSGGYLVYYSTSPNGPWTLAGSTTSKSISYYNITGLQSNTTYFLSVRTHTNPHANNKMDVITSFSTPVSAITAPGLPPTINVNRFDYFFGYIIGKSLPPSQSFTITNTGGSILNWSVYSNVSWLSCTPVSGTQSGIVTLSIIDSQLQKGTYTALITVIDTNATNSPITLHITLTVKTPSEDILPFGEFSTPLDGSIVSSSIPVTGWALDDTGIDSVKIYIQEDSTLIYIGDAVFVEGARPDVEAAYPGYPFNYKAGWGYMMLTNFLPRGGNGTYILNAIATDFSGQSFTLGTKTINVDNQNAKLPFGAIDTPLQGGGASGKTYINFGWVLTPPPNLIPIDGSTIFVLIDSVPIHKVTYGDARTDIRDLFPGYLNHEAAGGHYYIDTSKYSNGVHTIAWVATDNAGNTGGIGSRFFNIMNSEQDLVIQKQKQENKIFPVVSSQQNLSPGTHSIKYRKGFSNDSQLIELYPNKKGVATITIEELERLEIYLTPGIVNLTSLPVGATLDNLQGIFYWQPVPGFIGNYNLEFLEKNSDEVYEKQVIQISIVPKVRF